MGAVRCICTSGFCQFLCSKRSWPLCASLQSVRPHGAGRFSEKIAEMIHAVEFMQDMFIKGIIKAVSTQQSNTCALNSVRVCCSSWPLRVVQSVQPEDLRHPPVRLAVCPLAMCLSTWKTIMENFGNLSPLLDHHR